MDLDDSMKEVKVASFVTINGDWDWNALCNILPSDIVELFAMMKTLSDQLGDDVVDWCPNPARKFTMKSAYEAMYGTLSSSGSRFKKIWKLAIFHVKRLFNIFPVKRLL